MKFEWDLSKDKINKQKHGISFTGVLSVFNDAHMCSFYDNAHSMISEDRWISIGMAYNGSFYTVVHTYRTDNNTEFIRIISARKAVKFEEKEYINRIGGK